MAAQTLDIGGVTYDVYVIVTQADEFLAADFSRAATWNALTADQKGQAIVSSTRRLDRLKWQGVETDLITPQPLEWPRTGVTDCEGTAIADNVVPTEIDEAVMTLAADIAKKPSLGDDTSTDSNLKRVLAGSVEVEFFRAQGGTVLPSYIMELVSCFMDGQAGAFAVATGTDVDPFTGNNDFERNDGFK